MENHISCRIGGRDTSNHSPTDRDILFGRLSGFSHIEPAAERGEKGVTPPFVKNCTLRPEFTKGIGVYPGRLDLRWTSPRSHQGCAGGRATEAQPLSLLQARGLTYKFL